MEMDDVFFNAKLNISAAEGDETRGLVFDRKPLVTNPCMTVAKVPRTQKDMSLYVFYSHCFLRQGEKPLNKRGWVFQERILSPRIIHFSEDQVFWECWSLRASEILPHGAPNPTLTDQNKRIGIDSTTFDSQEIRSRWCELVGTYSSTSLSFVNDHLLGISAVAKRFCTAMRVQPSEYLAGMWKNDLPLSMIWHQDSIPGREGPAKHEPDLEMEHAPSWSWASIMASTTIADLPSVLASSTIAESSSLVATTSVINIEIRRRSRNFFDGTDLCRLRLRGPLCKFRRHLQDHIPWIQIAEDTPFQEVDHLEHWRLRFILIFWDTARSFASEEYFLLHIATIATDEEPEEGHGVILLRTAERGTYKRVGAFWLPNATKYFGSKLEDAFNGDLKTLDTEDYLEIDSDGKYTIDVI
ncbi:hypothetical protein J7T55_006906 [Diaporthe amygdali]|uniref:uncharacterized protein n=1 Tax=Phomopsis amygdali TaxID=1214568 RepID=UPI0022FE2307|nr:uncharacterized protein J7T55_006906 [Diaporthe amygdali]KAJ0107028.1 hypothetical protein J7T55_006906 [Diaporthe amygdali]